MIAKTLGTIAGQTATHMHHTAPRKTPIKHLFRLQYASNLPHTLSVQTLSETIVPVAKTLVLLGHVPDPEFVMECGRLWQNVLYAPFCAPVVPLHSWPKNVHVLHQNHKPFHYLPKDNVGFLKVSPGNLRTELYSKWTYRGASVVLLSQDRLGSAALSHYSSRPPLAVFANAAASCNITDYHTLSVSNPATLYNGERVRNYDKKAFAEFLVKDEKECAVDYDLARSAAALQLISLK
jgi:hypothetical protein